jgi:hypothetical protein
MRLFRSEDDVETWTSASGIARGTVFDLERMWRLASTWYDDRLELDWSRRSLSDRQVLFDAAGLNGPFWSLQR